MSVGKKVRVLIVDDSLFFRKVLSDGLEKEKDIQVIGTAIDVDDAKVKIKALKPDVLTLDVEMPKMNGIEFLKQLMQTEPLPVIMVSGVNVRVFDTLAAGAVDFVKKPQSKSLADMDQFFKELSNKIKIASVAELKTKKNKPVNASVPGAPVKKIFNSMIPKTVQDRYVIAIGASTGGTEAILEVLQPLPKDMPGIVVTQHMPTGFTKMYAERANRLCALEVKEAEDHDLIQPGRVLIAPGGMQMTVVKRPNGGYAVRCQPGEKVSGHCPSVDVLFQSVADKVRQDALGVILTGMGSDGAKGLLNMRMNGAYTIGQDKESSVVYGMPMVAFNSGAVCKQVSCGNISDEILQYLRRKR